MLKLVEEDKLLKPFAGIIEKDTSKYWRWNENLLIGRLVCPIRVILICIMGCIERMRGGCFENGRQMPRQFIC